MIESLAQEGERLMALITVLNANGLRVNNLFQIGSEWQANLTDGRLLWEFGRGPTPTAALDRAWQKALAEDGVPGLEPSGKVGKEPKKAKPRSAIQSILALDLEL